MIQQAVESHGMKYNELADAEQDPNPERLSTHGTLKALHNAIKPTTCVIPAKAGIQYFFIYSWIPAFAGMTGEERTFAKTSTNGAYTDFSFRKSLSALTSGIISLGAL